MSPEGYVHMSVIGRFNRVRALTQDIAAIKEAMVGSTVVELAPGQCGRGYLGMEESVLICEVSWLMRCPDW